MQLWTDIPKRSRWIRSSSKAQVKMNGQPAFQAFEERMEQLGEAIVTVLLATGVLGFMFFLIDLV